jgi:hypothetical protein
MDTDILMKYLPLLIPVLVIELALLIAAFIDIIRREQTRGPKWIWLIVILFNLIGPIVYFLFGRKEE